MTTRGPGAWTSALEEDEGNGDGYGKDDDYHDEDNENGRYKNEKLSAVTVTTRGPGALLIDYHHEDDDYYDDNHDENGVDGDDRCEDDEVG